MARTGQTLIRPMLGKQSPFNLARLFYAQYSDLNFETDLADYLQNGFVYSGLDCFAMAKIVDLNNCKPPQELAWFVRIAVGMRLDVLLSKIPLPLPKICFCRNNDNVIRVYDWSRMKRLAKLGRKAV